MLIDFDNVTLGIRSDLQTQLRRLLNSDIFKGKVSVQRAYADWRRYPQYIVPLSESSIDLIFAPAFGTNKKNATDIRLAIDALELIFTRPEIGTFILLSGDSDFSSLVLKLKEYGKYVIGVGIRESSSDLLIQNCDEYYSYHELTGLAKESDVEHVRQDPWQLVVQAVTQMRQRGDVMRSDRLKQVMQEVDPNFDEKDAGFSRFSKFVVEAGQRGLLQLNKMENGQYEIDLGSNANVPPDVEEALRKEPREAPAAGRRRRPPRDRAQPSGALTLAAAFGLLKDALLELNAVGDEATDADQVRERMMERSGAPEDPIFERNRFQRLLRQANDAGLIDLVKSGEAYLLKVSDAAPQISAEEPAEAGPDATEEAEEPPRERAPRRRGERGGTRRGGRGGRGRGRRDESKAESETTASSPAPPAPPKPTESGATRNPRFRRGSRRGGPPPGPSATTGQAESVPSAPPAPPAFTIDRAAASGPRSLRLRHGSRGTGPRSPAPDQGARPAAQSEPSVAPATSRPVAPAPPSSAQPAPRTAPLAAPDDSPAHGDQPSLLKRMSTAFQRAMRGGEKEKPADD